MQGFCQHRVSYLRAFIFIIILYAFLQYQKEHGDCRVNTRSELGKWVVSQRGLRGKKSATLTDARIELLDKLGFLWCGLKEGHAKPPHGGDP